MSARSACRIEPLRKARFSITQPLGLPVEPDVKIMYRRLDGATEVFGAASCSWRVSRLSSLRTNVGGKSDSYRCACEGEQMITLASTSEVMYCLRSTGCDGSRNTK